jgi:hypothetical protein
MTTYERQRSRHRPSSQQDARSWLDSLSSEWRQWNEQHEDEAHRLYLQSGGRITPATARRQASVCLRRQGLRPPGETVEESKRFLDACEKYPEVYGSSLTPV